MSSTHASPPPLASTLLTIAIASSGGLLLAAPPKLRWERTPDRARKAASRSARPLLLVFTDQSLRSSFLKEFTRDEQLAEMRKLFVAGYGNCSLGDETATKYKVTVLPTAILLFGGREKDRWEAGDVTPAEIGDELRRVLIEKAKPRPERRRLAEEKRKLAELNEKIREEQKNGTDEAKAKRLAEEEAEKAKAAKAQAGLDRLRGWRAQKIAEAKGLGSLLPADEVRAREAAAEAAREWTLRRAERRAHLGTDEPGRDEAVADGLRWLAAHQAADGSWQAEARGQACPKRPGCSPDDEGLVLYDVGTSALALLAFLGEGHTTRQGDHCETVARGLRFIRSHQAKDGSLMGYSSRGTYDHAIATLALAEAHAASGSAELRASLEAALRHSQALQNRHLGWKYGTRSGRNDTSVTGWMALGLIAGREAGLEVSEDAFTGVRNWFARATAGNGDVGYETPGGGSSIPPEKLDVTTDSLPAMTGVSVGCLLLMGERTSADAIRKGRDLILAALPRGDARRLNYYAWFWEALALAQFGSSSKANRAWRAQLVETLGSLQEPAGCAKGSWPPTGLWGDSGGRVYSTAMAVLALEAPYRVEPAAWRVPGVVAKARLVRAKR